MESHCVVEALASTLYRVLADATSEPTSQAAYTALAKDEARHFGMFNKMLEAEAKATGGFGMFARLRCVLQRVLELEDSQIMVASCVVADRAAGTYGVGVKRIGILASSIHFTAGSISVTPHRCCFAR